MRASHPAAEILPLIQGSDFDEFCADIRANGMIEPITLHPDGRILDGRNRARACEAVGVEPRYEEWLGSPGSEVAYVVSKNVTRRHLDESQRDMIAARIATMAQGRPAENAPIGAISQTDAASMLNVSRRGVQRARVVLDHGAPELVEAVDRGEIAVSQAAALARQPQASQVAVVERVRAGERGADAARRVIREERREERTRSIIEQSVAGDGPEAATLYPVILADPPWRYEHAVSTSREIENQYPTMTLDEICALPVGGCATPDAVLYLWVTSPKLEEGLRVMREWGFSYRSCLVWVKDRIGMGYWARQRHELLLVGVRGNMPPPPTEARPDSVIEAPRGEHSVKPVAAYEMIERCFPGMPRLELFARRARDGWDRWGHEA